MSLQDKLKERVSKNARSFYVEEWDETIWVTPLSCGEVSKLQKRHPNFLSSLDGEAMVDLIVMKALKKDGDKAFTIEDKPFLLKEEISVVARIAGSILAEQVEDDPKN